MWYYGVFCIVFFSIAIGLNIGALVFGSGHWSNWIWIGFQTALIIWAMKKLRGLSLPPQPTQKEPAKQIQPAYNFTSPDYKPPSVVTELRNQG